MLLSGCESPRNDDSLAAARASRKIDSLSMLKRPCVCSDTVMVSNQRPEISFGNSSRGAHYGASKDFEFILTDDEMLAMFSHDSVRLTIKSIAFSNHDTIPEKFRIFENVEIIHTSATHGLDMFPKLRHVMFFDQDVQIDSTMKWPRKVEALTFEKCRVSGLTSFKPFHNLTYLNATYSFFDAPVKDIQSLSCLQVLVFGAHMQGDINVEEIDISEFSCLRRMVLHSWAKDINVKGIPKGLDHHSRKVELEVNHLNLTASEKVKLNEYNKLTKANKQKDR